MTQADPSGRLSLTEGTGEFFSELDSFLHCMNECGFDSRSFDPSATATSAASDGFLNAGSELFKAEMLRDEDILESLLIGSGVRVLGPSSFSASELSDQHGPMGSDPYLVEPGDDFDSQQQHQSIADPAAAPADQLQLGNGELAQPTVTQKHGASASAPDIPKPKTQNQNVSRKRQREEIVRLRVSMQELQLQLETLLSRNPEEGAGDHTTTTDRSRQKKKMLALLAQILAWKRTASDEKVQSEQAAAENLKLRALIDENLQICKSLSETCSKSRIPRIPYEGFKYIRAALRKPTTFNTVSDSAIFASLRENLDAQYQRVHSVWAECDFAETTTGTKTNRLRSDARGNVYLEHVKSHVFPFTAESVSRSVWKLTKSGLLTPTMDEPMMCRVMGNTLYATLADTIPFPNAQDSTIKVWVALKRFIDDHQVVMVFQVLAEIEHSNKHVIQVTESGWNVVQSLAKVDQQNKKNLQRSLNLAPCASQTCIWSLPGQNCEAGKAEFADDSPTVIVLNQFHDNMALLNQTIENFLLDESLASSNVINTNFDRSTKSISKSVLRRFGLLRFPRSMDTTLHLTVTNAALDIEDELSADSPTVKAFNQCLATMNMQDENFASVSSISSTVDNPKAKARVA